jgi:hypothetical protein
MRGKIFRQQGSKLSGKHNRKQLNTITNSGSGFAMGGTISHRPLNPDLMPNFDRFRISSGKGSKAPRKKASKKSSGKKKGNFKSLKFNF